MVRVMQKAGGIVPLATKYVLQCFHAIALTAKFLARLARN